MKKLGIYIHIPFCETKCNYCDFTSFAGYKSQDFNLYTKALIREIKGYSKGIFKARDLEFQPRDYKVNSIFIGGGTPSLFPLALLNEIIEELFKCFNMSDDLEFTIESNPNSLNKVSLIEYKQYGINRLSIGAQSFDNEILRLLGRIHNSEDIKESFRLAREVGFKNINIDLMFGIPTQDMASWGKTIYEAILLEPEHLSTYSLKIEDGTPFSEMVDEGRIAETDANIDRMMYEKALYELATKKMVSIHSDNKEKSLNNGNYLHYEISNFAKRGYECVHNLKYWSMDEFLGIGLNAHSYINSTRSSNIINLKDYIGNIGNFRIWEHENSIQDEISEYIFTGMRKREGISIQELNTKFSIDFKNLYYKELDKLLKENLVSINEGRLKLTIKGINISNTILANFV